VFAYAVAVFQMLTGGSHPTDGIAPDNQEPPSTIEKIRHGVLPGLDSQSSLGFKPIPRIPTGAIPSQLRGMLTLALSPDPQKRPSLNSLSVVLASVLGNLKQCSKVEQHWFDSRDGSCGWCQHVDAGRLDPWSPMTAKSSSNLSQAALPPVSFSDSQAAAPVRRAAPAVAGIQAATAHNVAGGQSITSPSQSLGHQHANRLPQQSTHNFQNTPQQSYSGSQPLGNGSSSQQNTAVRPQHPRKYKGKMILDYADGTWGVRPSMDKLLKNNPKVAFYCMREETPSFAKAWWENSRPVAIVWGLVIGLIIALGFSIAWLFFIPLLEILFPDQELARVILEYLSYGSVTTAGVASLALFFSAVKDMFSARKQYGSLDKLKREKIWKTVVRFLPIPVIYGPVLLIIAILIVLSWTLDALTSGNRR
jgi:hypothetical protein